LSSTRANAMPDSPPRRGNALRVHALHNAAPVALAFPAILLILIVNLQSPLACVAAAAGGGGGGGGRAAAEAHLRAARGANRADLNDLLRIQSVSADPARKANVAHAANWLVGRLAAAGLENVVAVPSDAAEWGPANDAPGSGPADHGASTSVVAHPVVFGEWTQADDPDAPTVLIYGHYDVQPEDPVDLWTSSPFEPEIRNGCLYARGASDDKGHVMSPIFAIEAWLKANGKLPVNVKVLIEGEEEIGSPNLLPFLKRHRERLVADYVFSADGGQISPDEPGLCLGLRGTVAFQVDVHAAATDAHSGTFGGGVQNPLHVLARILATIHDRTDGSILVDGFYDDVEPLTAEEKADIAHFAALKPDSEMLGTIGVSKSFGERGYSFYERTWARPSLEVVGMWGGFTGHGMKTVLPREAHAKLSARLAHAQDPERAAGQIKMHILNASAGIEGVRVDVTRLPFTSRPFKARKDGAASRAASQVLEELFGKPPVYFYMGGSIPATSHLQDVLDVDTVMFAFGHSDENIHAPDEFARLDSLDRGEIAYTRLLEVVAREHKASTELPGGKCCTSDGIEEPGRCDAMPVDAAQVSQRRL
jgi:acetylornithine deacetylase/succinyl-diaminopimelate desuccinylase-like protein